MNSAAFIPAVTYAIGDIHGRSDLLKTLLGMILDHRRKIEGTAKIVFLGDYVDRGPDPKGVFEILRSKQLRKDFDEVIVLKGNHELMLIEKIDLYEDYLRENVPAGVLRERFHNIEKVSDRSFRVLKSYLRKLPSYHSDGIRLFTHAGIAPGLEIDSLSEEALLWYRGPVQDKHGRFVVHGHTSVLRKPKVTKHAVNIDTMAYGSSQLTCAVFKGKSRKPTFLWTPPDESALLDIETEISFVSVKKSLHIRQALRLEKLFARVFEVLGSEVRADKWMQRKRKVFGGKRPIDMAATDAGMRAVERVLGHIEHGVFS